MSALENLVGGMTLAELARRANTSVEQVVTAVLGGARSSAAAPASNGTQTKDTAAPRAPKGKVPRGGLRLDQVLTALASLAAPAKLDDVRGRTGGSVPQVRAALQKLAESGEVKITGERRGTRYLAR